MVFRNLGCFLGSYNEDSNRLGCLLGARIDGNLHSIKGCSEELQDFGLCNFQLKFILRRGSPRPKP